ncbi:MAG: hypothetical protein DRQ42_08995 [Gammaproteobacteria bacterium]|nr:MAG: hypothetical protein DRQ42_08995 [Gammaproteobacteria bacterium]
MTATEVNVRYELMQRLLGPTFGGLKTDLLDPIVERAFNILYRAGKLPQLPEGLEEANIDVNYTGPLARSQKFEEAQAIQNYMMTTAQLAEAYPEALDIIDVDGAMSTMAILQGVPAKALKGKAEIKEMREQRKQQQEAAMQTQQAQEAGAAMQSVGQGAQAMGEAPPEMMQAIGQAAGGQ